MLREWLQRFRALVFRRRLDGELAEDIEAHLEMAAEENRRRGMSPDEAAAAAERQFGGVEQMKEAFRDQRGVPLLDGLTRESRIALRSLRRRPGFASIGILTLAVGIGVNTAVFSLIDAVLIAPLPYPDGDRLAMVWQDLSEIGLGRVEATAGDFRDWRAGSNVFDDMAGYYGNAFNLTGEGTPERYEGFEVTPNLFRVLGVEPLLGRSFANGEGVPGTSRPVILSFGLWQDRFGGDSGILGRSITLNGQPYEIVGVMPSGFAFPRDDVRLWAPFVPRDEEDDRNIYFMQVVAALVLFLAALGIYGLMAFVVSARRKEFGLRVALGAHRRDLAMTVLGQGTLWIGCGLASGFVIVRVVTGTLESLLYEVEPLDALSLFAAVAALCAAGIAAVLIPVWRATRVDPMTVLRFE